MQFKTFVFPLFSMLALMLTSFVNSPSEPSEKDRFVVVLDAGHGGHDPGNLGNGYLEKEIALNIVLKAGEQLGKDSEIEVIYTRKDDRFVDLFVRGEIANKANADLFVSVHCDSHSSNAEGAGTFVLGLHANKQNFEIAKKENSVIYLEDDYETRYADYDINSPESVIGLTIMQEEFLDQSIALAKIIQDNFSKKLKRTDRKVKQAGFIVLHQTFMPSVLVETGFLTNKQEGAYLNSKKGQADMGQAIANAVITYKNTMRGGDQASATSIPQTPSPEVASEPGITGTNPESSGSNPSDGVEEDGDAVQEIKDSGVAANIPDIESEDSRKDDGSAVEPVVRPNGDPSPTEVEKEERTPTETAVAAAKPEILFRVQLMASSKRIPPESAQFKGLHRITREPYKNLYRYLYGGTASLQEAEMLKSNAVIKGYKTAYIVAYKDGERIPFKQAMEYVSQ